MATVDKVYYNPEANRGEFTTDVTNNLRRSNGQAQTAGIVVGQALSDSEQNLIESYALDPSNTQAAKALAKEMNILDKNGKPVESAEALQLVLKSRMDRAMRAYASFTEMLSSAHQSMMRVIQSIGG